MCLKLFILYLFIQICRTQIFNPALSTQYGGKDRLKFPEKLHIAMHVPNQNGSLKTVPLVHNHGSHRRITTATKHPTKEKSNANFYSRENEEENYEKPEIVENNENIDSQHHAGDEWAMRRPPGVSFARPPGVDYKNFYPNGQTDGSAQTSQTVFNGETPPNSGNKPFAKVMLAMYPQAEKLDLAGIDKSGARSSLYNSKKSKKGEHEKTEENYPPEPEEEQRSSRPEEEQRSSRPEEEERSSRPEEERNSRPEEEERRSRLYTQQNSNSRVMGPYNIRTSDFYRMLHDLNAKNNTQKKYFVYQPLNRQQENVSPPGQNLYYQRKYYAPLSSLAYFPPFFPHHPPISNHHVPIVAQVPIGVAPMHVATAMAAPHVPINDAPMHVATTMAAPQKPIANQQIYNPPTPPTQTFENREYYFDPNVTKKFDINLSENSKEQNNNNIPLFWDGKSPMNISITQRDPENHTIFTYVFDPTKYIKNMSRVANTDSSKISVSSHSNFLSSNTSTPSKFKLNMNFPRKYFLSSFPRYEKSQHTKINKATKNDSTTFINIFPAVSPDSNMAATNTLREYYSAIPEESFNKLWTQEEKPEKKFIRIELGKPKNQTFRSDFKSKIEPLIITSIFRQFLTDLKKNVTRQETAKRKLHFSYRLGPEYFKKELGYYDRAQEENFQNNEEPNYPKGEFFYGGDIFGQNGDDFNPEMTENQGSFQSDEDFQAEKFRNEMEDSSDSDYKNSENVDENNSESANFGQDEEIIQNYEDLVQNYEENVQNNADNEQDEYIEK